MALVEKQEVDLEIQSHADKLFNIMRSETHHLPNVSSDKVPDVEVHDGDWHLDGSIKLWKFTMERSETPKGKVEIDDENKTVTFVALEGDLCEHCKSCKATIKIVPKGDDASLAKITAEYEKLSENIPLQAG